MPSLKELRRKLIVEELNAEVEALYGDYGYKRMALQKQLDEIKINYTVRDAALDRIKYKVMCNKVGIEDEYIRNHWFTVWIPGLSLSFFVMLCYIVL